MSPRARDLNIARHEGRRNARAGHMQTDRGGSSLGCRAAYLRAFLRERERVIFAGAEQDGIPELAAAHLLAAREAP